MKKVTGYDYIDSKIHEIITKLPKDDEKMIMDLFIKTHSVGVSLGYVEGKRQSKEHLKTTN